MPTSTWSHSRLECFRQCPRKFFFRYVRRVPLPDEPETIAQFVGSRAHEALEWLYGEVRVGRVPGADALAATFARAWDAGWHDGVGMLGELTAAEHRALAERWLADYHGRHAPFADARVVALEQRIEFPLDDAHRMQGFIDRLARGADGTWQIHDYKTNRRLPTQQAKDADPQLAYYEIGIRAQWPDQVERVELTWHFLAFDTAITSRRTSEQLAAVRDTALATIRDAESRGRREDGFPTRESNLCAWCEYAFVCPARRHLVATAALPPSRYANEPGVKLVDRWAELDAKRQELRTAIAALEHEVDEVKDALAAYAREHALEVVGGAEREATIKRSDKVVFPRRSDADEADDARALEAQLRASPWWPDVSEVDRFALVRLWARRESLAADLRALLEEFSRTEAQVDLRLRRRRE